MNTVFIGHFSAILTNSNGASSTAGNQVQREIFHCLVNNSLITNVFCYSMSPNSFWPKGPLIVKSNNEGNIEFIGFINIPIIKHIIFSYRIFLRLLSLKPKLCIQYNPYVFENIALLLFKFFISKTFLVILIQDVFILNNRFGFFQFLTFFSQKISIFLSHYFNMIIPISYSIIEDFKFSPKKCYVFQGGLTEFAQKLMLKSNQHLDKIAVFAGSLELHNGVDLLIDRWLSIPINYKLHIFGSGSLEGIVRNASKNSNLIVFHGKQSEKIVLKWQLNATWNLCFRYSKGINQKYFFPSKFFNIICAPGALVTNDFYGIPLRLRRYIGIASDDLSDLSDTLDCALKVSNFQAVERRRVIANDEHSWSACISEIVNRAYVQSNMYDSL